jgi:hypothetical protein
MALRVAHRGSTASGRNYRHLFSARGDAVAVYAGEFNTILRNIDNDAIDGEDDLPSEDAPDEFRHPHKKGNPRKLSKVERKRREILKKL